LNERIGRHCLDEILQQQLSSCYLGCALWLVVHGSWNDVLSRDKDKVCDDGVTNHLAVEVQTELNITGTDGDIARVEQVGIHIDLEVPAGARL
jgi:hypothetical protein